MSSTQQQIRRRQHLEGLCAATLRALSGEPQLQYRGRLICLGDKPLTVRAPHLRIDGEDLNAYRGVADGLALRLLHSDAELHARLRPPASVACLVFDWIEQLRVESLAPASLPGLQHNVLSRFVEWSRAFVRERYTEGKIGELMYTVAQVCWARLHGRSVLEETEDMIESQHGKLVSEIGQALAGLRRSRHDQETTAQHAVAIAEFVADRVAAYLNEVPGSQDNKNDQAASALFLYPAEDEADVIDTVWSGESPVPGAVHQHYQAFTASYDSELSVDELVRGEQLSGFRERLDVLLSELSVNPHRLARYFRARLSIAEYNTWNFGEEEGRLDGRRLAQIVSAPAERRIFMQEQAEPRANTVVGLLIDCSGSMKTHGEYLALLVDRLVTALDMAGITSEILGFTTNTWHGGRARKDWIQAGWPDHPGRLNEVRHLVFKSARQSWRRQARRDLGALLKTDLFREGVDGEAIEWACSRLSSRIESRRILVVISDGSPMDSATQLANDAYYLDSHLKQIVARRSREGEIEIRGLGIGLDLSPFYADNLIIDPKDPIDTSLLGEVARLIAEPDRI